MTARVSPRRPIRGLLAQREPSHSPHPPSAHPPASAPAAQERPSPLREALVRWLEEEL